MLTSQVEGGRFTLLKDNISLITNSDDRPILSVHTGPDKDKIDFSKHYHNLNHVSYDEPHKLLHFHNGTHSITFSVTEEKECLTLVPIKQSHQFTRMRFRFPAEISEPVFGSGGVASGPNLRGLRVNIYTDKPNPGERVSLTDMVDKYILGKGQASPLYALPSFFTGQRFLFMAIFGGRTLLNFTHKDYHEVEFYGVPEKIFLSQPKTMSSLHALQSELIGTRFQFPTLYEAGVIASVTGGSQPLLETIDILKASEIPMAALYIKDWSGTQTTPSGTREFWDWVWSSELYPHLDQVMQELSGIGINVLCSANPHLSIEGRIYAEASKNGYLLRRADGTNLLTDLGGFMVGHLDLTNTDACNWAEETLAQNIFEVGFSGIVSDYSGFFPTGSTLSDDSDGSRIHNYWAWRWTQIIRKAAKRHNLNPVTILGSGSVGASFSAITANGAKVDWAHGRGLKSALSEMLSLSLSGVGISHCDFETFTGFLPEPIVADQLIRWAELSIFTPAMRMSPFNNKMVSLYQSDPTLLPQLSRLTNLRKLLAPYMNQCLKDFYTKSIPPMQHIWEQYPDLKNSHNIIDQFMLGSDLMVAPVTLANIRTRDVAFPEGSTWIHLLSGENYEPGLVTVDAPLGTPLVFYKKGGSHEQLFASLAYKLL